MSIKQLAVFVENHPGTLAEITDLLAKAKVDTRALSISETPDFGILRMITPNINEAKKALSENNCVCSLNDVVGVEIPDSPGGIAGAISLLSDNGINIEYLYAFVGTDDGNACVVIRVADNEKAETLLAENGYKILTDEDVLKL
jgi:hypothetical protein